MNAFRACSCPLCLSTSGKHDDPRISFQILPDCIGDIRPRSTAHHNSRHGVRSNTSGRIWYQTSVVHIQSENTYVLDPSHAWTTDTQSGQLYNTTNGGTIWFPISTIAYNLQALSFADASIGWGITRETLLHTIDGGKTWQQIDYTIQ